MRKYAASTILCALIVLPATAQPSGSQQNQRSEIPRQEVPEDIEQIEVKGTVLERLSTSETQYNLSKDLGLSALHSKNYDSTLRLLTKSAKHGNKISQFYLAKMYFEGLGTPINNKLGWAWLNVALDQKTPEQTYAFHKIANVIPDDVKSKWEPTVAQHIADYGADATDHKCRQVKEIGSNIITVQCSRIHDGSYEFEQWRSIQELFFNP